MNTPVRILALLPCFITAACATVGPRETHNQWLVAPRPNHATVTTSFHATCHTPCYVRLPRKPFDITIEKEGYQSWSAHYDPAHPKELTELKPDHSELAAATIWSAVAANQVQSALSDVPFITPDMVAVGVFAVVLPFLLLPLSPHIRRLDVKLASAQVATEHDQGDARHDEQTPN